jgi:hypothetical protein
MAIKRPFYLGSTPPPQLHLLGRVFSWGTHPLLWAFNLHKASFSLTFFLFIQLFPEASHVIIKEFMVLFPMSPRLPSPKAFY